MSEVLIIRHGQAGFGASGAEGYDRLTELGIAQGKHLGHWLRSVSWTPDRIVCGTLTRHYQTLDAMGFRTGAETHAGWNEYNFHNLLEARFQGDMPDEVKSDRKTHFRALRDTLKLWQGDELTGADESWKAFCDRVDAAGQTAVRPGADRILVVSSGGVIGQTTARVLGTAPQRMIDLNLQIKNTSLTRFSVSKGKWFLSEFNSLPHLSQAPHMELQSSS